jgi:hypothetical protein
MSKSKYAGIVAGSKRSKISRVMSFFDFVEHVADGEFWRQAWVQAS